MLDGRQRMSALQVPMSLEAQLHKNPSFMTFRRKFTVEMLIVSDIASYVR